jgi:hypothetical protein
MYNWWNFIDYLNIRHTNIQPRRGWRVRWGHMFHRFSYSYSTPSELVLFTIGFFEIIFLNIYTNAKVINRLLLISNLSVLLMAVRLALS